MTSIGELTLTAGGRISKIYGQNGELVLTLYDTFIPMGTEEPIFIEIDGIRTPFYFHSFRTRGKNKAVAVFEDIDTELRASELIGKEFFQTASDADPGEEEDTDDLFLEDLVGFAVMFAGIPQRGTLADFIGHEHNPLFEVETEGRRVLIPATEDFITAIDPDQRIIELDIPEGLFDLQ